MSIVYLEVHNWAGIVPGARHYSGELWHKGETVRVSHPLPRAEAARLNKQERDSYGTNAMKYKPGMPSDIWTSEMKLVNRAIEIYKQHFPDATVLLRGNHCSAEPRRVLDGPKDFKRKGNRLYRINEEMYMMGAGRTERDKLLNRWDFLVQQLGAQSSEVQHGK